MSPLGPVTVQDTRLVGLVERLDDLYGRIMRDPTCPSTHLAELVKLTAEAMLLLSERPARR